MPDVRPSSPRSLDEKYYSLDPAEFDFFKKQTGLSEEAELKAHILAVQAKAYKVHDYECIRRLAFTKLKISRLPVYDRVLELSRTRKNAILLDMGCCFGNDARKVAADGFDPNNIVAFDLHPDYWTLGHELFCSSADTFPATFIAGNVFDISTESEQVSLPPALGSLTSLEPLLGHVSVIHVSSFFHLFDEEGQLRLAHILASFLSPERGSIIFGSHVGRVEKGFRPSNRFSGWRMFCHSPQTWKELWEGVCGKGRVIVEAQLHIHVDPHRSRVPEEEGYVITWSVERL